MHAGNNPNELFDYLCKKLEESTKIPTTVLLSIPEEIHVEMGRLYLIDLINATLPSSFKALSLRDSETKVIFYNDRLT